MLQLLAMLPLSNENGLARTPPLGWRSWNTFGADVNQSLIEGIMDGMARRDPRSGGIDCGIMAAPEVATKDTNGEIAI